MYDETKNAIRKMMSHQRIKLMIHQRMNIAQFIQLDYLSEDEILEEQQPPQVEEPSLPLRRSTRQQRPPDFYGERVRNV